MTPKYVQDLVPETWEHYLMWQRDSADVIKLMILGWRDFPGLSSWALNVITVCL